jgi:hypothetical protein
VRRIAQLSVSGLLLVSSSLGIAAGQGETVAFAVVAEALKDKTHVSAKISVDGVVFDGKLLPVEAVQSNLAWKKLEICHALKLEGVRVAEGFKVTSLRVIDAGMLPMGLQGFAGDCLIKKAVEVAPLVD